MVFLESRTVMSRPNWINSKHWEELVVKSGISPEIAAINFKTIEDAREVDQLLSRNTKQKWKHSKDLVPGWAVIGVDPETGETNYSGVQFKADRPRQQVDKGGQPKFDDEGNPKYRKYESPEGIESSPLFLNPGDHDFWLEVLTNLSIIRVYAEGPKKAAAGLTCGYATISLPGVWNGQKQGELHPLIKQGCEVGRTEVLAFDMDMHKNPNVVQALDRLGKLLAAQGAVVKVALWDEQYKGLDDLLVGAGKQAVSEAIDRAIPFEMWRKQMEPILNRQFDKGGNEKKSGPKAYDEAEKLVERYRDRLAWDTSAGGAWFQYEAVKPGVWSLVPEELVQQTLKSDLAARGIRGWNVSFMTALLRFMKMDLVVTRWCEEDGYLPFTNGVLDLSTNTFAPHNPGLRLRWSLPFEYQPPICNDRSALQQACAPIWEWLCQAVGDEPSIAEVLVAYLAAVLRGRVDLQRYLECIGRAGSGKGTFIRLATALIGKENVAPTTLHELEKGRFEMATVANARLVAITEAEKFAGDCIQLKALTGQDNLRQERKGIQQEVGQGQYAKGMVILAGERVPISSDSGGMDRRRLTISFTYVPEVEDRRNLITDNAKGISGEFAPYLPAFLNLCLSYTDAEITDLVRNTLKTVPRLTETKSEALVNTNSLAAWADTHLYWTEEVDPISGFPKVKAQVGLAERNRDKEGAPYKNSNTWLYASYIQWCELTGYTGRVNIQNFTNNLEELFNNILKMPILKRRERVGSVIYGIRLKEDGDPIEGIVTTIFPQRVADKNREKKARTSRSEDIAEIATRSEVQKKTSSNFDQPSLEKSFSSELEARLQQGSTSSPLVDTDHHTPLEVHHTIEVPEQSMNTPKVQSEVEVKPQAQVGDRVIVALKPYEEWMSERMKAARGTEKYPSWEYKNMQDQKKELESITDVFVIRSISPDGIATIAANGKGKGYPAPLNSLLVFPKAN